MYYNNGMKEIKTIKLPLSNKEVKYYSYLTAKENRDWIRIMAQKDKENIDIILEAQDFIFKTLIESFDGSSEDISNRLLELPKQDFKHLDNVLGEVVKDEDFLATEKN